MYALASAVCFAVHNYLAAQSMHLWRNSVSVLFPNFIPFMLGAVLYRMIFKSGFSLSELRLVTSEEGRFMPLIVLLARGANAFVVPISI